MTLTSIVTPRLVLSPLVADDAARLFAYRSDPAVRRFQSFEPRSIEDARAFIVEAASGTSGWRQLGIRMTEGGLLVGDIGFCRAEPSAPVAEIGITVAPDHQRQGIGAEALRGLLGHLFGSLELHRVFASVDPDNTASLALLERVGMRREAHFRQSLWFKGRWVDDVVFAMLRSEWPPGCGTTDR